jgi:hypothetical protein
MTRARCKTCTRLRAALVTLLIALAAATAAATAHSRSSSASKLCGGEERWKIKTLSDSRAGGVRFDAPQRESIHYLITRADPHVTADTLRDADGSHVETTVYHLVGARLVDARIEEDGDIHLVIRSKYASDRMIVELPNVACKGARVSLRKADLGQARADFATQCGLDAWETRTDRASPQPLLGKASIVGVGFFDLKHPTPQSGVAPNNIELHPLLQFSAEGCRVKPH